MNAHAIRSTFLKFFQSHNHQLVPSSSVVPESDPTLLFTNAGMNQFKDVLLGHEVRDYKRAASTQKCVRAGGKHNDLDDVGRDARHLTFFEMLGNWSFGDYYKKDAIVWAWDLVKNHLKLDTSRVYVTIYKDDDESFRIWHEEVGLEPERILRLGDVKEGNEENFWSMGPTGPCGPCTEMHYDLYPEWGPLQFEVGYDEDRIIEFWNIVFMEFNRDEQGNLESLSMRSVDTGMGLERIAMIMAGKPTVFHTELFTPIFEKTIALLGESHDLHSDLSFYESERFPDFAVIADHIRTITFSLADGAKFSNEGRGSVLRSILRRAVRHGRRLGFDEPFLCKVSAAVVENFKEIFPEVEPLAEHIAEIIRIEEERFFKTIDAGCELFEAVAKKLKEEGKRTLSGDVVFKLHATHGFPPDMTRIMAEEEGMDVDMVGYAEKWKEHQEASKGEKDVYAEVAQLGDWVTLRDRGVNSRFVGYSNLEYTSNLLKYRHIKGEEWEFILEETPFYAEAGGQVADHGTIQTTSDAGELLFHVTDVQKGHIGTIHRVELKKGVFNEERLKSPVECVVDKKRRVAIMANHTATHLLHLALRTLISDEIFQAGSLVAPDRLRFDFSYDKPLTREQIASIEDYVNQQISDGLAVHHHFDVPRDVAIEQMGAMAIFGEKYGEVVRVIEVEGDGPHSVELCGGTHVTNTKDIQLFEITSETGIAAGIRRIEAITGSGAIESAKRKRQLIEDLSLLLKSDPNSLQQRVQHLLEERQELTKQVDRLTQKIASSSVDELFADAKKIKETTVLSKLLTVDTRDQLLAYADKLREKLTNGVVLLGAKIDDKPALLCLISDDFWKQHKIKAGDLINEAASFIDGRGGGRPTLAQAGGSNLEGLPKAIEQFASIVEKRLQTS